MKSGTSNDLELSQSSCDASFISNNTLSSQTSQRSRAVSEDSDEEIGPSTSAKKKKDRKEKSLGKLCRPFFIAMGQSLTSVENKKCRGGSVDCRCTGICHTPNHCACREIHLETVAKEMKIEKRRLYDIVNVMEALDAMSKGNKSCYIWNTLTGLPMAMAKLQRDAVSEGLQKKVVEVQNAMMNLNEVSLNRSLSSSSLEDSYFTDSKDKSNKNSLAVLCSRFIMVLLCNKDRKASLDVASTLLIKKPDEEGCGPPNRSRCRRLYDIANILVALGLVQKVQYLFGTKKIPVFQYCGPEPAESEEEASKSMTTFINNSSLFNDGKEKFGQLSQLEMENKMNTLVAIFGVNSSMTSKYSKLFGITQMKSEFSVQNLNANFASPLPKPLQVQNQVQQPQPVNLLPPINIPKKRTVLGELPLSDFTTKNAFDKFHQTSRKRSFVASEMNLNQENGIQKPMKSNENVPNVSDDENKENVSVKFEAKENFHDENDENAPILIKPKPRTTFSHSLGEPLAKQILRSSLQNVNPLNPRSLDLFSQASTPLSTLPYPFGYPPLQFNQHLLTQMQYLSMIQQSQAQSQLSALHKSPKAFKPLNKN